MNKRKFLSIIGAIIPAAFKPDVVAAPPPVIKKHTVNTFTEISTGDPMMFIEMKILATGEVKKWSYTGNGMTRDQ